MAVSPRSIPVSPEGSVWDAISDLRREVRQTRESLSAQLQRGFTTNIAGVSGIAAAPSAPTDLGCSIPINVPSADSRVFFWATWSFNASNNTSGFNIHFKDDVDFVGQGMIFGKYSFTTGFSGTTSTGAAGIPQSPPASGLYQPGADGLLSPYGFSGTYRPTAGDHVFSLAGSRDFGAGTVSIANLRLWVGVL